MKLFFPLHVKSKTQKDTSCQQQANAKLEIAVDDCDISEKVNSVNEKKKKQI